MPQSAENVLKQIDEGRFDDVWRESAAFVRSQSTARRFADDTRRLRAPLGTVARRGWSDIMPIQFSNAKDVPDGLHANVDFTTTLQGGKVVFEKLSLRRESGGQWRLVSYAPRQQQGVTPALARQQGNKADQSARRRPARATPQRPSLTRFASSVSYSATSVGFFDV
ncbi:DUF4019 domain-containing protein [Burkholderia thailandensis]|uniref:DUF4019 domain-containing protein n=1 Tax=Burkholderia thailandensis TaxID=57975 RepID=UPI000371D4CC|nr:DUF4019 domain-containing protein [Burkholderia thailandensis]AHI67577.1 hypothetical protein BTL_3738 [Burkholderia thailandensis H0587]AOJ53556.1 hypothetical protein AQ475_22225 [Burkholderia thailandensis]AVR28310.1 DUF4019 domain-containing protein [Burkholderia thailandensis]MCS3395210.1 DUF4019 domain-containing protein [Burkholderia thailandensis]MCS6428776.1 DUF4019 domain-containing protein [Burkholderia thailandensis]